MGSIPKAKSFLLRSVDSSLGPASLLSGRRGVSPQGLENGRPARVQLPGAIVSLGFQSGTFCGSSYGIAPGRITRCTNFLLFSFPVHGFFHSAFLFRMQQSDTSRNFQMGCHRNLRLFIFYMLSPDLRGKHPIVAFFSCALLFPLNEIPSERKTGNTCPFMDILGPVDAVALFLCFAGSGHMGGNRIL
jgi:hypothetical protein